MMKLDFCEIRMSNRSNIELDKINMITYVVSNIIIGVCERQLVKLSSMKSVLVMKMSTFQVFSSLLLDFYSKFLKVIMKGNFSSISNNFDSRQFRQ